ncbi:hypothetical protein O9G_000528 [Rozella allomycis CSF55]|uniref:Uncharacterized protein n=1 Tax=Rozella allomycis (strain CSF55) TaxID=988480 RepID=A0A075B0K7_ROZAC|nr:hypothetical protein O9G_000528 [Rozella allomycis CSF55]|eukprot:EPZ34341.1 hypothetical protein O9G_000528 [Rozella allomycis CSF55]
MRPLISFLQRHPNFSNCLLAGVLAGAGDIVSQIGIEKRDYKDYDQIRTARFMFIGVVIESHPLKSIDMAKKVFLDQIVYAPFTTGLFFVFNGLLERIPFDKIQRMCLKNVGLVVHIND